jgi:hypothetical protein
MNDCQPRPLRVESLGGSMAALGSLVRSIVAQFGASSNGLEWDGVSR